MAKQMTQQQFRVAVSLTGINSLPILQACEAVLVHGESQYAVAHGNGMDQGQLSKACKTIRKVGVESILRTVQALDEVSMLAAAGLVDFAPGDYERADQLLRHLREAAKDAENA